MQKMEEDEDLLRQVLTRSSADGEIIRELLDLAPRFQNLSIYGAKAEFSRAVEKILDDACATSSGGGEE